MSAAPAELATDRPAARPLPGAIWQAHVLDASAITAELNRLWGHFGSDPAGQGGAPPAADGDRRPFNVVTRASTLNLTAVARSRRDAHRVEEAVTQLSEVYPSRATILVADPERQDTGTGLDVRVALLEQEATKGRPAVLFECVIVEVAATAERHLASIASPLLVADLPDFLWWAGDAVAGGHLFEDLIAVSDRLIVDSASFAAPATELAHLSSLLARTQGCPKLSDFAWARLVPWRQLATQFFDPPSSRDALNALDGVEITFAADGTGAGHGFTAALLFAGWLATRLGWRSPGEILPVRSEPGSWRATLRAGASNRQREVALTLRPATSPRAPDCLAAVALNAAGGDAGSFRIERVDSLGLATRSDMPGLPSASRLVYAETRSDAGLLAEELRMFGRDLVFEESLAFAAALAPTAGAAGSA